jgi:hypothetical protein
LLSCFKEEFIEEARQLKNIFEIKIEQIIVCLDCQTERIIEMSVPNILRLSSQNDSFTDSLHNLLKTEYFERMCSICSHKRAKMTQKITTFPKVFLLSVNRFEHNEHTGRTDKIRKNIKTPIVLKCGPIIYTLGSGLTHEGRFANRGHCIVNWRDPQTGMFTRCSHSSLTVGKSVESVNLGQTYLACYVRKKIIVGNQNKDKGQKVDAKTQENIVKTKKDEIEMIKKVKQTKVNDQEINIIERKKQIVDQLKQVNAQIY